MKCKSTAIPVLKIAKVIAPLPPHLRCPLFYKSIRIYVVCKWFGIPILVRSEPEVSLSASAHGARVQAGDSGFHRLIISKKRTRGEAKRQRKPGSKRGWVGRLTANSIIRSGFTWSKSCTQPASMHPSISSICAKLPEPSATIFELRSRAGQGGVGVLLCALAELISSSHGEPENK